ncbi:RNA polymerase sigma factor [Mucilaginibacter aquariorum]|uniref:RNA polymerase sigma-70 factor n=1 Tax=Mucilaginibacter aquariorum TaxID=2967225 RepID=A0ABT1SY83_9SPHI|nr:RNA polymerase sigma-70 factor [Mucilaginibacter aquariorum]MCQ6957316.1 RNA polymerase sigma-70 factor [Mucilaginibacter aquariorum]
MTKGDKMILDEQQLLLRLKKHDQEAFTVIYNTYAKKLFRYAVKIIKSSEIAEDTVHDVFVKLWNDAPSLNIESSIQPYLYKVTRNHLLNLITREGVQDRFINEIVSTTKDFTQNTEDTLVYRETLEKTMQAIDKLPAQRKLIFEMRRNNGMSHSQIARELNIADSTVNNQLVKALKYIKNHLLANGAIGVLLTALLLLKN